MTLSKIFTAALLTVLPFSGFAQPFEKTINRPKEAKDANLFEASLNDDGTIDLWYHKYAKSKKKNIYTYLKVDQDFKLISTEVEKEPVNKVKKGFDPELGESYEKEGLYIKLGMLGMSVTPETYLYEFNEKKDRYIFQKTIKGKKTVSKSEAGGKYQYLTSMLGDGGALRQAMINDAILRGINPYAIAFAMKANEGTWYGETALPVLALSGGKAFVVMFNLDGTIASETEVGLTPGLTAFKSGVLKDRFWMAFQAINTGKNPDPARRGLWEYIEISNTGEVLKLVKVQLKYPATTIDEVSVSDDRVIFAGKADPRFNNVDDKAIAAAGKKDVLLKRTLAHVVVINKTGLVKEWTEDFKTISPKAKTAPKGKKPGKFAHTPKLDARANVISQHADGFDVVYAALDFYGLRFSNDVNLTSVYAMAGSPKSRVAKMGSFMKSGDKTVFTVVEFFGFYASGLPMNVPMSMYIDASGNPTGVYNLGLKKNSLDFDYPILMNEKTGKWIFFGGSENGSQIYFGDVTR